MARLFFCEIAPTFVVLFVCAMITQVASNVNTHSGRSPIMGWSGYNAFMQNSGHCDKAGAGGYNETTFVQTMDALVSTGLRDVGYVYLNADDCWIAQDRVDGKLVADASRFPHGMKWLSDKAHSQNLKLGLYAAASVETCRQFPGSQGFEEIDAKTFADYGADFAKLDSCGGTLANGTESWYNQYGRWSDAMNATGVDIVFSCSWAVYFTLCAAKFPPHEWEAQCGTLPWNDQYIADKCHMWRYGSDLDPVWSRGASDGMNGGGNGGVGDVINFASSIWANQWRSVTSVGAFNDPDFLVVGCPLDRPCEGFSQAGQIPLNLQEQQTQFSMWCILNAPLIIGSDIRSISKEALAILSQKEAISIQQDVCPNCQPRLVSGKVCYPSTACPAKSANWIQIWARQLSDGDVAVAMVNMDNTTSLEATLNLVDVVCAGCSQSVSAHDIWAGTTTSHESTLSIMVAPHETKLLRLTLTSM